MRELCTEQLSTGIQQEFLIAACELQLLPLLKGAQPHTVYLVTWLSRAPMCCPGVSDVAATKLPHLEVFELLRCSDSSLVQHLRDQVARMPGLRLLDLSGSAVRDLPLPASLTGLTKLVAEDMKQVGKYDWCCAVACGRCWQHMGVDAVSVPPVPTD